MQVVRHYTEHQWKVRGKARDDKAAEELHGEGKTDRKIMYRGRNTRIITREQSVSGRKRGRIIIVSLIIH